MAMSPAQVLAKSKPKKKATSKPKPRADRSKPWESRLRELRMNLGLTLEEVASAVGLTASTMLGIEQGCDLRLSNAMKLSEFYDKAIGDIWQIKK